MKYELSKETKILIVGLGLMGLSYAKGLTKRRFNIDAIDLNKEHIDYAIKNKYINNGWTEVDKKIINNYDIIIFALYPKTFVKWIEEYGDSIKDGALITDVTGIKSYMVYKIQDMLKDRVEYIPAHPMAGKENSKTLDADEKIFYKANYIITPTKNNSEDGIEICTRIAEILNFEKIAILTPEKHDEMIAFLSQLTHIIAVCLMDSVDDNNIKDYTGDSFRDLTRIAKINDEMWSELFILNKEPLLKQIEKFETQIDMMKKALNDDDKQKMKQMMQLSTKNREQFDK